MTYEPAGATQVEDGGGDVLHLTQPLERRGLLHGGTQLVARHHDVERGGGGGADPDGVDPDARRQVARGQAGVLLQRALHRAVAQVAPAGHVTHHGRDVDDRPPGVVALEHAGHGGPHQGVPGRHVEAEGLLEEAGRGVEERPGHGAPHVVHDDVEPAELAPGPLGQRGHEVVVGEVARNDDGPPPRLLDLLGHHAQLRLGAGGQHDVRTGLGQGDGGGGTDAAAAGGDDGDVVGDEEAIEDHPRNIVVRRDPGSGRQVRPGPRRLPSGARRARRLVPAAPHGRSA